MWYNTCMTKLQSIMLQIEELPAEEREELAVLFGLTQKVVGDQIFELTEAELADLNDRIANDTVTYSLKEVFDSLKQEYEPGKNS